MNFSGDVEKQYQREYLICNTGSNVIDSLKRQYSLTVSDFTLLIQLNFLLNTGIHGQEELLCNPTEQ